MPYVKKPKRVELEMFRHAESAGDLNYLITLDMLDYLDRHGLSYNTLNEIVGAVSSALAEFQRRVVGTYEDTKIRSNGDLDQYDRWRREIA
jgi:hypothetical protein